MRRLLADKTRYAQEGGFEEKNVKTWPEDLEKGILAQKKCHMRTKIKKLLFYERKKKR